MGRNRIKCSKIVLEVLGSTVKQRSTNRADRVDQAVEHLPSKTEALNSNPSTTKKIEKYKLCTFERKKQNCYQKENLKYLHKKQFKSLVKSWVPVAHAYNPSYSGGRDQEDHSSKADRANSSRDPISKNPITKIGLAEWLKV
jgi:hypothetical protein